MLSMRTASVDWVTKDTFGASNLLEIICSGTKSDSIKLKFNLCHSLTEINSLNWKVL
jgi:hypothetical protein